MIEFLIGQLPSSVLLFVTFLCLVALGGMLYQRLRWVAVLIFALSTVVFSFALGLATGQLYVGRFTPPLIRKVDAIPPMMGRSEPGHIIVDAVSPLPNVQLLYRYRARGTGGGGEVPRDWTAKSTVTYTAPDQTGDAYVTVTVHSGGRKPLEAESEVWIGIYDKDVSRDLNKALTEAKQDLEAGSYAKAIYGFSYFKKKSPNSPVGPLGLGLAHSGNGDWADALFEYASLTERQPSSELGFLLQTQTYLKTGSNEQATASMQAALSKTKDPVRSALMKKYLATPSPKEREVLLTGILQITPSPLPLTAVIISKP
jgi:hypothetical protein